MRYRTLFLSTLLCAACAAPRDRAADSQGAAASSDHATTAASPREPTSLVVTMHGIGAVRVGMTVDEARAATHTPRQGAASKDPNACGYLRLAGVPAGVSTMVEGGRVVRVDVDSARILTDEGAQVGDTEDRIKSIYAGRIAVSPHKYTDGHYLTVRAAAESDSAYRLVFETDGRRVTRYRAGVRPQVEYVEGCA